MNDEDAFQAALDANPDDHTTRLVFADWLDERGDARGSGYRALGVLRRYSVEERRGNWVFWLLSYRDHSTELPEAWVAGFRALADERGVEGRPRGFPTRRECEDAAAKAFAMLPASHRLELLTVGVA